MKRSAFILAGLIFAGPPAWANSVVVSKAWVRATLPGQSVAGAYLDITAKKPARLIGVRSPVSPDVQIHWMQMDGEVMRMREVAGIDLPKNTTVRLKPGSYHLMLMDLKKPILSGETIPLSLVIETQGKRETVKIKARAQATLADAADAAHHHAHPH